MASWGTSLASSPRSERASLGASPRTAPATRQDLRTAAEAFAQAVELMDKQVALMSIKTPVRFNQVAECEGILEQWHVEYQANTAQRKSWLCPSGESFRESWTGSDTRFAVSEMPVTKRPGRKRKIP